MAYFHATCGHAVESLDDIVDVCYLEYIYDVDGPVEVQVYAPWCKHCATTNPSNVPLIPVDNAEKTEYKDGDA